MTRRFRPDTRLAVDAVERALELARNRAGAGEITAKGPRDIVTATDVAVEDAVREVVARRVGFEVVGEERGGAAPTDGSYWLVDPICGTRNFASGIPLYCVNVALVEGGRVELAVVGDASTAEIVVAERGGGAWALGPNARQLAVSDESCTVVIEDSHSAGERRQRAAEFVRNAVLADRWELRALSTSLSLAYVAAGRIAAYVLFWTSAVHAAAGSLVATEAGATVTDIDGRPWTIDADSILASATPALHDELLALGGLAST